MICSNCKTELPAQQGFCPHCGTFTPVMASSSSSFSRRHPALTVVICIGALLALCSGGLYFLVRSAFTLIRPQYSAAVQYSAVVHGAVAGPADFTPKGHLYFVPMGRQAIDVEKLAEYYQQKFHIHITVLPAVPLSESSYSLPRQQYAAEDVIADLRQGEPALARDPDAVLIALTDEDIYRKLESDDRFTYSYHAEYRLGVVSTHRMDPGFWGDPPSEAIRLANTKQMLTKYVGYMYFHVPLSYDPTSVMRWPLTPDGGSDNLYQSDLHSEESANGLQGNGWPCISFVYSYSRGQMAPVSQGPADCNLTPPPTSPDEEVFSLELGRGRFVDHGMDLKVESTPPMEYRRAYISDYARQRALGWGADVSFNTGLTSDGASALTYIEIVREDSRRDRLERISPGRGFSSGVMFEGEDPRHDTYGARMTWDRDHFKIKYRDGSSATYLPCGDFSCYWTGSEDAHGNKLIIERGPQRELLQVRSQDGQKIMFVPDAQRRIQQASDTSSRQVAYEYDAAGCLVRVHRPDGRVIVYEYDPAHRMTSVSVIRAAGEPPVKLLTNEYDPAGHVLRQTLADGSEYKINYQSFTGRRASELTVREPSGRVLHFKITNEDYKEWTYPVRYRAVSSR